jgi:hypothetical protein
MISALGLFLVAGVAQAGSGPWVISEGDASVYIGAEVQRLTRLATGDGAWFGEGQGKGPDGGVIDVDSGIESTFVKFIPTFGLRDRVELELDLPWARVEANRVDGPVCTALPLQPCATTEGIGVVGGRVKALLLDELSGSPVSVAAGGALRVGTFTNDTRARITNLGEGTTDLGPFLAVGRSGGLSEGYWSAWVEGAWRHRFANTEAPDGTPVPGDEFQVDGELLAGARPWWSAGPAVTWYARPDGVDFGAGDLADIDRFGALRVANVRAGGKLILRSSGTTSFVLSALGTVYARNNPADLFAIGAGVSYHPKAR